MANEPGTAPLQASVWIVDDSPLESEMARRALEPAHRVESFIDGAAVLEHIASHPPPDALVLDWQMPGISGIEVCQFLRSKEETAHLPILMLTMNQQTRDLVEGLAAGADDFLTKPYNAAELAARIAALIRTKRAHERLERAERSVRNLLQQLPEAVLTFTSAGLVTFANREAEHMLAMTAGAIVGKHVAELLPELPWKMIVANRLVDQFALPDLTRHGKIFAPLVRAFSAQSSDGALSFRDVTRERQNEESRLDLYSVVAHDLRAPLSTMIMRADRLLRGRRGPLSTDVESDIALMKQRMIDLVAMVSDFLDLARIDAKDVQLERAEMDLRDVLSAGVLDFIPMAESKGVTLTPELPSLPVLISGDRRRLVQVLSNLLSNAIKFAPAGSVVKLRCEAHGDRVDVSVSDTGPGIPPSVIPKLFSRYVRASETTHAVSGTGLGLMIVKQLVRAHGGDVRVLSTLGSGATFVFTLPLVHQPAGTANASHSGRTVLIVDDDEDLRDMLAADFAEQGYSALQAEDGLAALELLVQMNPKPDVMLLDVAMPRMSGTELLEKLGELGIVPAMPVVVISAHAMEAKLARRVLRKPVPVDLLLQIVEDITSQSGSEIGGAKS